MCWLDNTILYMHVQFEVWNFWISWACETTNHVEVAQPLSFYTEGT